jgi:hypothetical protein
MNVDGTSPVQLSSFDEHLDDECGRDQYQSCGEGALCVGSFGRTNSRVHSGLAVGPQSAEVLHSGCFTPAVTKSCRIAVISVAL